LASSPVVLTAFIIASRHATYRQRDRRSPAALRCRPEKRRALASGAIEIQESVADAAVRETFEETGMQVEASGLLGIYSDPRHLIRFTSNDEARREFSIVLTARMHSPARRNR
jgi:ADP-ribose pyrophosphatase YjhB (NUDIX family)